MSPFIDDIGLQNQIKNVIEYSKQNVYNIDDLLDMMNGQLIVPGGKTEHLVLFPLGQWVCYYLVDHPQHGTCHYLSFTPNAFGSLPDTETLIRTTKKFGIDTALLEEHILFNKNEKEVTVRIPID